MEAGQAVGASACHGLEIGQHLAGQMVIGQGVGGPAHLSATSTSPVSSHASSGWHGGSSGSDPRTYCIALAFYLTEQARLRGRRRKADQQAIAIAALVTVQGQSPIAPRPKRYGPSRKAMPKARLSVAGRKWDSARRLWDSGGEIWDGRSRIFGTSQVGRRRGCGAGRWSAFRMGRRLRVWGRDKRRVRLGGRGRPRRARRRTGGPTRRCCR